ncbi:MAG TPA: outer membrane lipoprotein-sorting protein [Thauera sp.]|uniref:outer membrane lipoprotein-sorting protein n=1 Tax=Thauera sp. TaxID=1905334 RepID=UPI002BCFDB96|nr:outer membrane lipoprotein-sorting protein [Thauera sp.]HRP22888.1 outer membrane lipoprotein-sorting protein [Thauera sp.]HRP65997.1 outer membrane lipoprotein-sorting protein [Thauera sp.]
MTHSLRSRRHFIATLAGGLLLPAFGRAADEPAATDAEAVRLVTAADAIRFPRESFQTEITVRNFSDGVEGEARKFRVLSRGNENTIVLTLEPATERGQALLMRGRDLWVFMPSVSQPVRLSLAQRLTGQVANGDLARANFAGDYTPTVAGRDTVGDASAVVLELAAVDRGVTYARVKYWVGESDIRPLKAEFYALSGRLLKTALYEDFRQMAGQLRPTRLVMEDALKKGEVSVLTYENMNVRELPERMFTREYMRRLQQ